MVSLKISYRYILLIFCFCFIRYCDAKIIVKSVDCLGNLTVFDYDPGAGNTISSINWDFGDGYSSANVKSTHIYKSKGFFTITVNVNLGNGGTQSETTRIEIVGLPRAVFNYEYYSDSCYYSNFICYKDLSAPAVTGQTITKRILVWGDGGSDISNSPKVNDVLCHKYNATGAYKVTMEVTDKFGCKSITSYHLGIAGDVKAYIGLTQQYVDCKTISLCYDNNSQVQQPARVKYYWYIDSTSEDTNSYIKKQRCINYMASKTVKAGLKAVTNSGCTDSITNIKVVDLETLPGRIVLSDSVICYGDKKVIKVVGPKFSADLIEWEIDNVLVYKSQNSLYSFNPRNLGLLPGKHVLLCRVKRGNCNVVYRVNIEVKGPIAKMEIINQYQCYTNRQVSMFDRSQFVDTAYTQYFWTVYDPDGGKCTTDYVRDYQLYSNCNYAFGKYHKHVFSNVNTKGYVILKVKDIRTGCTDLDSQPIGMLNCSKIFDKSNYTLCQGDVFLPGFNGNVQGDPVYFTVDSGRSWRPFPSQLDPALKGIFDVGFIFRKSVSPWVENIGNDSIRIHRDTIITYDTIFKTKFLNIKLTKSDTVTFRTYPDCGNFRLSIYFMNKVFYSGEKIEVEWGDGKKDVLTFKGTTYVDSLFHRYAVSGVKGFCYLRLYNASGCYTNYPFRINFGKNVLIKYKSPLCLSNKICLESAISDNITGQPWLDLNGRKLEWMLDDTISFMNRLTVCHKFLKAGPHSIRLTATDSLCTDTFKSSFFLQDVKAVIRNTPKVLFCSELRQFFDSSYVLNTFDPISSYKWDFGTNTSTLKDPFISFNSSADSVTVKHIVQTGIGCADTARLSIQLVGGKPYFTIKDTIACGSMNAIFFNKSRNCKSYIWEFGDSLQSTLDMNDTQFVRFFYDQPGRYHIKLKGIDTIYNPSTGNTYYCITEFPGKDSVRDIVILPMIRNAVYSKDTICLGDSLEVSSRFIPEVIATNWNMGDGFYVFRTPPDRFRYLYTSQGAYRLSFTPVIKNTLSSKTCADSAFKIITVLGVKADFEKAPVSYIPYTTFNNLSRPSHALLSWDFGQPATGSLNYSNEQNPSVIITTKFREIQVCLRAAIPFGCADTVCKPYSDTDSASVILFNVFTPGQQDNKNDCYDIPIEGEDLYDLRIYDRWGVLVFSDDQDRGYNDPGNWNGKVFNKGPECPSGTYYYLFRYRIPILSKDTKIVNGVIELIR